MGCGGEGVEAYRYCGRGVSVGPRRGLKEYDKTKEVDWGHLGPEKRRLQRRRSWGERP